MKLHISSAQSSGQVHLDKKQMQDTSTNAGHLTTASLGALSAVSLHTTVHKTRRVHNMACMGEHGSAVIVTMQMMDESSMTTTEQHRSEYVLGWVRWESRGLGFDV